MKKIIIAIDGEASSGKSTLAKALAKKISYKHINTGSMYRAVTLAALQAGLDKTTDIPVLIDSKYQRPVLNVSLIKIKLECKKQKTILPSTVRWKPRIKINRIIGNHL